MLILFRIAGKICTALFAQFRQCASFAIGEFAPGSFWKKGVEVVTVTAVEEISAGDVVCLAFDHQIKCMIDDRQFHAPA